MVCVGMFTISSIEFTRAEGDTVEFTMVNYKKNGQSHSMDFHALA